MDEIDRVAENAVEAEAEVVAVVEAQLNTIAKKGKNNFRIFVVLRIFD